MDLFLRSYSSLPGALNGNIGVAKCYLYEICDDSNAARGLSVIGLSSGIGRLVGPAVGAYLSNLADQYPDRFGDNYFLLRFPYAVPCLVGTLICVISFILAFVFLTEIPSFQRPKQDQVVYIIFVHDISAVFVGLICA